MTFWKRLLIVLPLMFISMLGAFGIVMVGGVFHEWRHTNDYKTESLCLDYTNDSFMYVTTFGVKVTSDLNVSDSDSIASNHFEIYQEQGVLIGALGVLFLFSFIYLLKHLEPTYP
jgi:hypothetical protein